MGNRALISFKEENQDKKLAPSIYLHWQGGRDSVEAFLEASQILGIRGNDGTYCIGRINIVLNRFFRFNRKERAYALSFFCLDSARYLRTSAICFL